MWVALRAFASLNVYNLLIRAREQHFGNFDEKSILSEKRLKNINVQKRCQNGSKVII